VLYVFERTDSVAEELHKEDVRIRPCMFAINWDNLCRLLYPMPPRFFVYDSTQMENVSSI